MLCRIYLNKRVQSQSGVKVPLSFKGGAGGIKTWELRIENSQSARRISGDIETYYKKSFNSEFSIFKT